WGGPSVRGVAGLRGGHPPTGGGWGGGEGGVVWAAAAPEVGAPGLGRLCRRRATAPQKMAAAQTASAGSQARMVNFITVAATSAPTVTRVRVPVSAWITANWRL